ncbi:hypothetical protein L6452_35677 [Arctium lappa]|uniref:Uncharacterized protein n=1 Tax=Arctium lappa TaxID=4217 RepID=A0ACB8Y748_ARCLA|nr:hypothetical protein L6452_35677 [Arctium lappa]
MMFKRRLLLLVFFLFLWCLWQVNIKILFECIMWDMLMEALVTLILLFLVVRLTNLFLQVKSNFRSPLKFPFYITQVRT